MESQSHVIQPVSRRIGRSRDPWSAVRPVSNNELKALCEQAFEHARDLYSSVPRNLLRFNIRIAQIVIEVQRLLPDILSLQEVDRPVDVVHSLEKLGWVISADAADFSKTAFLIFEDAMICRYQYHYVERTGDKTDGCACFWWV